MAKENVEIVIEAVTDSAQEAMDDVGNSMEDVGTDAEQASEGVDQANDSLFELDRAAAAAGVGMAAIGGAMQKTLNDTKEWRSSLARTAETVGMSSDEMNDLATDVTDATFSMEEATVTLESLSSMGVDSRDDMERLAGSIDELSDATGTSSESIARDLAPAINGLDGDLDALEENADAFTLAARESTLSLEDLGMTMQKLDFAQLEEMGIKSDEVAGLMAEFADETGYSGQLLEQNFNSAVQEADGDLGQLTEELGLGDDALDDWNQQVAEAEGVTKDHADAANESVTTMDRLSAAFDDVKLMAGGMLGPIDALAPVLMGLGGAMTALSTINFSAVIPSLVGVWSALVPLLPVILPLVAVVGVLGAAWKTNFMDIQGVTDDVLGALQDLLGDATDHLRDLGQQVYDTIQPAFQTFQSIMSAAGEHIRTFAAAFMTAIQPAMDVFQTQFVQTLQFWFGILSSILTGALNLVLDFVDAALDVLQPFFELTGDLWESHGDTVMEIVTLFTDFVQTTFEVWTDTILSLLGAFFAVMRGDFSEALGIVSDLVDRNLSRMSDLFGNFRDTVTGIVSDLFDAVVGIFQDLYQRLVGNSIVPDMLTDIVQAVIGFQTDWVNAWADVIKAALDVVTGAVSDFRDAGKDLAGSVADGITDGISDIKSAGEDAMSAARDLLPGSDAKEGPLSDLTDAGAALPITFADAALDNVDPVEGASTSIADAAAPEVDDRSFEGTGTRPAARSGGGGGGTTRVVLDLAGLDGDLGDLIRKNADVRVEGQDKRKERHIRRQNVRGTR